MEERRMRAADMFEQGVTPAEIARQVGVSHQIEVDCVHPDELDGCRS
jgi:hypothetical protein